MKNVKILSQADIDKLGLEGLKQGLADGSLRRVTKPYIKQQRKVGRNELCPCGSNMKYKKCHGLG